MGDSRPQRDCPPSLPPFARPYRQGEGHALHQQLDQQQTGVVQKRVPIRRSTIEIQKEFLYK